MIRSVLTIGIFVLLLTSNVTAQPKNLIPRKQGIITVAYNPGHASNIFVPAETLGAAIDGHGKGENSIMLSSQNRKRMLSAGLNTLSYRLRTELGQEAWHWNPAGTWSETSKSRGYWISDTNSNAPIIRSYGYRLPRRGCTFDQANNDGYSRLDDGDSATFWKSNPYLDSLITGEEDSLHSQWVAVDLGKKRKINTLIINWADPYAVNFRIEYGESSAVSLFNHIAILNPYVPSLWHALPNGNFKYCRGGRMVIKFPGKAPDIRLIRIVCTRSSHTALAASTDKRDSAGYAIRELQAGITVNGKFTDYIRHGHNNLEQSPMFASTTDPWHRAEDIDSSTEQPGVDFIYQSGLTKDLPALFAVGIAYDIPENAVSLLNYFEKRKYALSGIELGEEPDGQYISAKDFAELYTRFAKLIHGSYPTVRVGGPSFQGILPAEDSTDVFTERQWLQEFTQWLNKTNALDQFQFFSFEWYPVNSGCTPQQPELTRAADLLKDACDMMKQVLPHNLPVFITEYGYSVLGMEAEVSLEGALLNADFIGQFFTLGGSRTYLYGYEPGQIMNETGCSWGNMMLFGMDDEGNIQYPTALYYSALLYAGRWARPTGDSLEVFPAVSNIRNKQKQQIVTAYALHRHRSKWSLMFINKDPVKGYDVSIKIRNTDTGDSTSLSLPANVYQFSGAQYKWKANGENGHPVRANPPISSLLKKGGDSLLYLPPYSITVVTEQ